MILDIFSIFDPSSSSSILPCLFTIFISFIILFWLLLPSSIIIVPQRLSSLLRPPTSTIHSQLTRTSTKHLKDLTLTVTSLFLLIIFINLLGIAPYIFRISSHLLITLSIGLPLWASIIISSLLFKPKHTIAHILPDGAPEWLNPFLVLIETTRVMVRPLTLSFRLAANITAGHVVLSLISSYAARALTLINSSFILLLLISSAYTIFEFAICLIQAYIFCLLLSLYSDDHA